MQINAPAAGTTAAAATVVGQSRYTAIVSSVTYIPAATQAGAATNNRTLTLFNRKTGSGTTTIASLALTSGTNLTDNTPATVIMGTGVNIEVGDVLEWSSDPVNTGIPDPGGSVAINLSLR